MARHTTTTTNTIFVTSDNGVRGAYGASGNSEMLVGQPGGAGGNSLDVTAKATAGGTFALGPSGTWSVRAASGAGGQGGGGGQAGYAFTPYGLITGSGGGGGTGGLSGAATAQMSGLTDTSFGAGQSVVIKVGAYSGAGGHAGYYNGSNTYTSSSYGGSAGGASAIVRTLNFTGSTDLKFVVVAVGGAGGGSNDLGGHGGAGGNAHVTFCNDKLAMGGAGHSILTVDASATGGAGGQAFSDGGTPGTAELQFTAVAIKGGAEDDTIQLSLNVLGGHGANDGPSGAAAVNFSGNSFVGNGGNDTLSFSLQDGSDATGDGLSIDMAAGTITLHDGVAGDSSSTFHTIENVFGGAGNDDIIGSKGNDGIGGGAGADTLTGGAGNDTFVYRNAGDSNAGSYDTITDLNFSLDHIDLWFTVSATDKVIKHASLDAATLGDDLAAAVGALASHHAVLVNADGGDLANHVFLVVNANGTAGFDTGSAVVIDVTGAANAGTLDVSDFV